MTIKFHWDICMYMSFFFISKYSFGLPSELLSISFKREKRIPSFLSDCFKRINLINFLPFHFYFLLIFLPFLLIWFSIYFSPQKRSKQELERKLKWSTSSTHIFLSFSCFSHFTFLSFLYFLEQLQNPKIGRMRSEVECMLLQPLCFHKKNAVIFVMTSFLK